VPGIAIGIGIVLIVLGVGGWLGTGRVSATALIPAFFGLPILLLGWFARSAKEGVRKHLMHAAVVIGLLGGVGAAVQSLPKLGVLFRGKAERPAAVWMQLIMCAVCVIFVALCVRSFIAARRQRDESAGGTTGA